MVTNVCIAETKDLFWRAKNKTKITRFSGQKLPFSFAPLGVVKVVYKAKHFLGFSKRSGDLPHAFQIFLRGSLRYKMLTRVVALRHTLALVPPARRQPKIRTSCHPWSSFWYAPISFIHKCCFYSHSLFLSNKSFAFHINSYKKKRGSLNQTLSTQAVKTRQSTHMVINHRSPSHWPYYLEITLFSSRTSCTLFRAVEHPNLKGAKTTFAIQNLVLKSSHIKSQWKYFAFLQSYFEFEVFKSWHVESWNCFCM